MQKSYEIKVFITSKDSKCDECRENLGRGAWITLSKDKGALCLACADLDYLVYLPSGNAALTRRAVKYSTLSAIVLKFSRARKRYERQGIMVESEALEKAEIECLADQEIRMNRQERAVLKRAEMDNKYVEQFANRVRKLFPGCPPERELTIAEHACLKYSGRIGRTNAAKNLDEDAVRLAVTAHIRHTETDYDKLLAKGLDKWEARTKVDDMVSCVLNKWTRTQ